MLQGWKGAAASAALLIALAGCAGTSDGGKSDSIEAAQKSCDTALRRAGAVTRCDRYVTLAVASGNPQKISDAYLYRAFLREMHLDLPGALADIDQSIAAMPGFRGLEWQRAHILAVSGDYAGARTILAGLQASDPDDAFNETAAFLEYVDGDRSKSPALFRSAAKSYREVDDEPQMAATLDYYAAIIDSELHNGDLAPIAGLKEVVAADYPQAVPLWRHRMGEIDDAELIRQVAAKPDLPLASKQTCFAYFSIGHRAAIAGRRAEAADAFRHAVADCRVTEFEHHAAKAWVKQLGG